MPRDVDARHRRTRAFALRISRANPETGARRPSLLPGKDCGGPLVGRRPASGLVRLGGTRLRLIDAYGIRFGPYLTILTVPRLTGCAFGGATSETTPVLKFITKISVDQRTPVWLNHEIISILWPTGSAV